jgi:DNA modification methylase
MADLVKDFTDPGETVIDPFLGSGTTGAACAALRISSGLKSTKAGFSALASYPKGLR